MESMENCTIIKSIIEKKMKRKNDMNLWGNRKGNLNGNAFDAHHFLCYFSVVIIVCLFLLKTNVKTRQRDHHYSSRWIKLERHIHLYRYTALQS